MLPNLKTQATAAVTALSLGLSLAVIPAAPAHAWGDKEQSFLAGVVTAVIVEEIIRGNKKKVTPAPAPAPVYVDPTPRPGSIYNTPAGMAFNSYSKAERKAIQRGLRASGYYRGGIDGSFGPGTYNAVVAYARDSGESLKTSGGAYGVYDGLIY